jgi:hypothetical protein
MFKVTKSLRSAGGFLPSQLFCHSEPSRSGGEEPALSLNFAILKVCVYFTFKKMIASV